MRSTNARYWQFRDRIERTALVQRWRDRMTEVRARRGVCATCEQTGAHRYWCPMASQER